MIHIRKSCLSMILLLTGFCLHVAWAGTTGKIAGIITDQDTGDPLPGANIVIEGTSLGAATNANGQYTAINVPPGSYTVVVSFIGYGSMRIEEVRIRIDQTTKLDFQMKMRAIEGEAVTVVADRHVIKKDVASSVANVSAEEIESLPVTNISDVINLQAGVQADVKDGIVIRGGTPNQSLFLVDGITFRDPRNNEPITGVSLSSISEIAVERGGFEAEYGQVRSGIINIVTKEGSRKSYFGSITLKGNPPHAKYFGISPYDKNSMWIRPYLDDAVCWTGTDNEAWSQAMKDQYPSFEGWNAVSARYLADDNPDNDLTPIGAQREYLWQLRRMPETDQFDYNIDAGFGGPVPLISKKLGDLRFFTSFRRDREMYIVPLSRDDYVDQDFSVKVTSNLSRAMTLNTSFSTGKQLTIADNWAGSDFVNLAYLRDPGSIINSFGYEDFRLFSSGYNSIADITHNIYSAKLTHTLNPKTFYEASLEYVGREYYTRPPAERNTSKIYQIVPGFFVDEALDGYVTKQHYARARDNSTIASTTFKVNLTSQLTYNHLLKAGMEMMYNDLDIDYGYVSSFTGVDEDVNVMRMHVFPFRGALYVQDKMEFQELIVNLGMRMEYSNSNTEWVDMSNDRFNIDYFSSKYDPTQDYPTVKSKGQWSFSPRVGISHPVTENSKLFFNYGHFQQLPIYQELFRVGRDVNGSMQHFSDPNLVLSKTIAYELGYDHALFDKYLLQLAGFYRDITDQRASIMYIGRSAVNYHLNTSDNYADMRGFEFTLRKNTGRWFTGFANYTYQVSKSGNFGYQRVYENPFDNRQYQERATDVYLMRPVPQPYATANINFSIPADNKTLVVMGFNLLKNINISLLANWQAGPKLTYNPKQIQGLVNNVQKRDYYNFTLRLNKVIDLKKIRLELLMEVNNLLNTKFMDIGRFYAIDSFYGSSNGTNSNPQFGPFYDVHDWSAYMQSLHLPKSEAYDNIVGKDKIGNYRKEGVKFQPIELYNEQLQKGDAGVIYYHRTKNQYMEYVNETWQQVGTARMDKILDDKAYIDMPNLSSFWFLNPRSIFYGVRVSFDLN